MGYTESPRIERENPRQDDKLLIPQLFDRAENTHISYIIQ
jgi:hypothetical protein